MILFPKVSIQVIKEQLQIFFQIQNNYHNIPKINDVGFFKISELRENDTFSWIFRTSDKGRKDCNWHRVLW
jgi:hypothetical protein